MNRHPHQVLAVVAAVAVTLAAGACTTAGVYDPTPLYTPSATPSASASASPSATTTPSPTPSPSGTGIVATNCLQSYAPPATMPTPGGSMPAGSYMETIKKRGHLNAGVSADTLRLGSRNPVTNKIEGFDIDMLHAVSQAIFGDPDKIAPTVITAGQREDVLLDGDVDIVARAMTINCDRWSRIAFSSEYYRSAQKVLVRKGLTTDSGAPIKGLKDLAGKKVCAPNRTTTMTTLRTFKEVQAVGADTHTGCLVLFQQGAVDAITGDATVLAGLAAQDPYAVVVQESGFTTEPYGLGINPKHADFVSFVNGVLADMRADGRWTKSYNTWLADALGEAPEPPKPVYGRTP